jgi:2,3-dihydro-2,3-dihydroxybenzoate dehydrogenase
MDMDTGWVENKVVVVTGASGGIGRAVARRLGEQGARIAAIDRNIQRLESVVDELQASGYHVAAFAADITVRSDVDAVIDKVESQLGPIDYLVNVAGVLRLAPALELSDEDWAATFAVNTNGVFYTSQAVANRMVSRKSGAIVTVASNAAGVPRVGMAAYGASKAAAIAFTKSLALELAKHGIRCNVVAPGSTDTDMLRCLWTDESGPRHTIQGNLDQFRVGIPLGKLAQPSDVANAVLFLLSDQASHITMHSLYVDGGAALGS